MFKKGISTFTDEKPEMVLCQLYVGALHDANFSHEAKDFIYSFDKSIKNETDYWQSDYYEAPKKVSDYSQEIAEKADYAAEDIKDGLVEFAKSSGFDKLAEIAEKSLAKMFVKFSDVIGYAIVDPISGDIVASKATLDGLEAAHEQMEKDPDFADLDGIVYTIIKKNGKNVVGEKVDVDWIKGSKKPKQELPFTIKEGKYKRKAANYLTDGISEKQIKAITLFLQDKDPSEELPFDSDAQSVRFLEALSSSIGYYAADGNTPLDREYESKPFGKFIEELSKRINETFELKDKPEQIKTPTTPSTGKKRLKDIADYVTRRNIEYVKFKVHGKEYTVASKNIIDGIYIKKDGHATEVRTQFKLGGGISANHVYIANRYIVEAVIKKDGKLVEYKGKDILDGIYVSKDFFGGDIPKMGAPKVTRTQFEEEEYEFGEGGDISSNYKSINEIFKNRDKSVSVAQKVEIVKGLIDAGYTDADLTVTAKSGTAYTNKVDKKTEQVLTKFYKFYDGSLKGNMPFQTIYDIIDMNSRFQYNVLSTIKRVNKFGSGGYVRPSATMKTTGIYKFVTKDKEYILEVSMFERENELKDSLQIQNDLRGELGSILINNNAWRRLSKCDTVTAKSSKSDVQGKLTRIDDLENVRKHLLSK